MKDHVATWASLAALVLILATAIWFVHAGMHEGTLLGVIITGAVGIAQAIAGIKPPNSQQADPIPPPKPVQSITGENAQ